MFRTNNFEVDTKEFQINTVRNHLTVLHNSDNWLTLAFLESLTIKELNPQLNDGIKATKAPQLF